MNSLRRFMPTMANVLQVGTEVAQAIGSWEEIPKGDGCASARASRPMSLHYSAQQALASGIAKKKVLKRFIKASKELPGVQAILRGESGSLEPGSLTWAHIAELDAKLRAAKKKKKKRDKSPRA